jgi:hypothetical protein
MISKYKSENSKHGSMDITKVRCLGGVTIPAREPYVSQVVLYNTSSLSSKVRVLQKQKSI